jgi:peptidoglycan/xylan/chitin deacetylase (PgdA/CDA1 family)
MTRLKAWLGSAPLYLDALLMAASLVLTWLQRARGPGNGVALVYHRLAVEPGDPARELLPAIAVADFERQLRLLVRRYRLVPASTLLAEAWARRRGARLPLAITFDDDDPGHLRRAAPALRRAGAPATFYLCGGSLSAARTYWWERLERVGDADLHATAARVEAMPASERTAFDRALGERLGGEPPDAGLRAADVAALAAGFEIGFHTREHHPLDTLSDDELAAALRDGREELASAAGQPLLTIAYPHGHADARTPSAVAAASFTAGFTTAGEPLRPTTDPRLIGRLEPRSPSLAVFALKLAAAHLRR